MRNEVHSQGVEIVTVCMETLGPEPGRAFVDAAAAEHPSLVDAGHVMGSLFGVVNIPNAIWIDESGMIVRPAEPAWPKPRKSGGAPLPEKTPQRLVDTMAEAKHIVAWTADEYGDAVRDWAARGSESRYVMAASEVLARSGARDSFTSTAAAHFALAEHFERNDDHDRAIGHFRQAHRLAPRNWTYKRQAWSIEGDLSHPMSRFWQGPAADSDGTDWPYESDWLTEIRNRGAKNYYRETHL